MTQTVDFSSFDALRARGLPAADLAASDNAFARHFRDAQGALNQAVAATAAEVQLVVSGLRYR